MGRLKIDITGSVIASVNIKVRISDINYGNHVGNDAFVSIIHEARMQWLQKNNFTELDIDGAGLIMSDLAIKFKNECFYGEEVAVSIIACERSRVGFDLYYTLNTIRNNATILLAEAKTGMVCYNYELKKITQIPDGLIKILNPHSD